MEKKKKKSFRSVPSIWVHSYSIYRRWYVCVRASVRLPKCEKSESTRLPLSSDSPRQSELAVESIKKDLFKQNRARGGNFPETFVTFLVIQFPGGSPGVRMERWDFILRVLRAIRKHLHFMGGLGHWRPGVRWRELTTKVCQHTAAQTWSYQTQTCV